MIGGSLFYQCYRLYPRVSRRTAFRKLKDLDARTSYSHRGGYYTLDELAVDFAQLVKRYTSDEEPEGERRYSPVRCVGATKRPVTGRPDPTHISTSYVERQNLNVRMGIRRFTRLTNAYSKKVENHMRHMALWLVYYNFIRIHQTVRTTPAMAAGLTDELHDMDFIMDLIEAAAPPPGPRGPYRPHTRPNRRRRSNP